MAEPQTTVTVEPVIITDANGVSLTVYTTQESGKPGENDGTMLAELIYNTGLETMEVAQTSDSGTVQVVTSELEEVGQGEASEVANSVIVADELISWDEGDKLTDELATKVLLQIIQLHHIQEQLHDKRIRRKKIWTEIADEMKASGINIVDKPADRCFQRFRNLERKYKEFIQGSIVPGKGRKTMPEFCNELSLICGDKHTAHSVSVVDTLHAYYEPPSGHEDKFGTISLENANVIVDASTVAKKRPSVKHMKLQNPISVIKDIRREAAKRRGDLKAKEKHWQHRRVTNAQQRYAELMRLMEEQHSERMKATYALINAVKDIKRKSRETF